jgi:cysteine desulfurase/selenocysteine lyase
MNQALKLAGHNADAPYDVERVRRDFPILSREIYGRPLVYLDNGASAQKPRAVIDAMRRMMEEEYANVHRGVHYLSQEASARYEAVRGTVAKLINAPDEMEVVFARGATEAINLVAWTWGRTFLKAGDEVIVSVMEHHANIVPWQMLRDEIGIVLKVAPVDDDGAFLLDRFEALLSERTKLVSVAHVSNVLGTVVPVKEVARLAHARGALVLIDGCQGVNHMPVDVQELGCDFYVFSGHKLYGPTGIGALWGRAEVLATMPPYQGGGDMIERVTFEKTTYKDPPFRFEAGTPAIVETIGLGAAIDYVSGLGMANIARHEHELVRYAHERLAAIPGLEIVGRAKDKASIVSFKLDGVHAHDLGTIVDRMGVAVRVGNHCAEPVIDRFGGDALARASFGLYNTLAEVDRLADALDEVRKVFG